MVNRHAHRQTETPAFLGCLLCLGHGASSWARGMQHKASVWPLPTVILAATAGEEAEEPQPCPAAPGMSLSAAHSRNTDIPPGKSTNSLFAHPRETCSTPCYPHFSPSDSKGKQSCCPCALREQQPQCCVCAPHCTQILAAPAAPSSWCFWACSTQQQGRNMEGFKNRRKKKVHSFKIKLQTRTTPLGNGIPFFAKPTVFANSQGWVTAAPLHSQGSLERRLVWLGFLLYKWYHLHSSSVSRA